jgi:hypothetical protein
MITLRTEAIAKKTPDSVPKLVVSSITDNGLGSDEDIQNRKYSTRFLRPNLWQWYRFWVIN